MFERFRILREENGLSQKELASELGIRKEIIESIENGYNPPIYALIAYAKHFHVSTDYIVGMSDKK